VNLKHHCKNKITWIKKLIKGKQIWKDYCPIVRLPMRMLKTHVKNNLPNDLSYFKKLLKIEMQCPFLMDDNKFYTIF
jgi:hypothetical protein